MRIATPAGYEASAQAVLAAVRHWRASRPAATPAWKNIDPEVAVCAELGSPRTLFFADNDAARALIAFVLTQEDEATWLMFQTAMESTFGSHWHASE